MQAKWFFLLLPAVALGLFLGAASAQADDVGKFTRVVNEVEQSKPGKGAAQLAKVTGGVANQDLVETKQQAMAVVQFVDESTITISPKSKVTIEDYMYDASKGQSKGAIKIAEGVVETIIPHKDNLDRKDIRILTTTAIAGIRGTKLITVVKPGGESSIFYVIPEGKAKPKKSTINIRMFAPDIMPDAATVQFVTERLQKKMPLTQVISDSLKAGLSPCGAVKAAILQGVKPEQLVEAFQKVCNEVSQNKTSCNPSTILKCTVEAMRALKEVNLGEMQYGLIMKDLAPITGNIKPEDLAAITALPTTGIQGTIPYSIPTQAQLSEAKLTQAALAVANAMINAGADPAAVNNGLQGVGITQTPAATYTAATTAAPAPPPPGVGAGGQPPEIASPAQ
jgi:hypothetical protein